MKEVTLYTIVKEKRVVAQDHIDFYERRYDSVPIYNLGGDTQTKESITTQQIPVEHRVFYRRGNKEEYYIAMTEDVRKVFCLELKLLNDYKTLCRDQEERLNRALKTNENLVECKNDLLDEIELQERNLNNALKTNESLVKYKNDLLDEIEILTNKVNKSNTLTFWQRLKFLFTGVIP